MNENELNGLSHSAKVQKALMFDETMFEVPNKTLNEDVIISGVLPSIN